MRGTYDPDADAPYTYLTGSIASGEVANAEPGAFEPAYGVNLDYEKDGFLLGIEILGARSRLRPECLRQFAEPG